ncbi:MAG: hypothetical protein Q8J63_10735 [Candidatus Aquicultor sp.]|nr:hypothetical protein [Candidatus Aquicultor sp.]
MAVYKGYISQEIEYEKLRVGQGIISTPEFSSRELEQIVAKEQLKYRLRQIKRPSVFYRRVIKRLFMDPRFFLNYAKALAGRLAKRK